MNCPKCKTPMVPVYVETKSYVHNTHNCPNCGGFMHEATYLKMWGYK